MDGTKQNDAGVGKNKFLERKKKHDEKEEEVFVDLRGVADRHHLPDKRQSFAGIPCSWDLKTTVFVEDNSIEEYWKCWNEGEPVFIVYVDYGEVYADWLNNLSISGPHPASEKSTSGDDYYILSGGREYETFKRDLPREITEIKKRCLKLYLSRILDRLVGGG